MSTRYEVTMVQGDNETTRVVTLAEPAVVSSARQLAGFLTHLLFKDVERGGDNTFYTIKEKIEGCRLNVFTVERLRDGHYHHA